MRPPSARPRSLDLFRTLAPWCMLWMLRSTAVDLPRFAAQPPPPPPDALGYPSRAPNLDARPGFRQPPAGYGEVPFWWWTGDPLDRDRLLWQIEELHRLGIAGVQVNYAHADTPGWPTYPSEPAIFSEPWWDTWSFVAGECAKRDMGIGLSGYTLDWPNGQSLVSRTIYSDPELVGRELHLHSRQSVEPGQSIRLALPPHPVGIQAYRWKSGALVTPGVSIPFTSGAGEATWTAPAGDGPWDVWIYAAKPKAGSLNPMHPQAGRRVVERFFQPFQDHAPGQSSKGLNYFFHDELQFGVGDRIWTDDLAGEFRARKGYELFDALPALFVETGPAASKARLDFLDVRMQLVQERYFVPIFEWHWSRGLVFGCDQGSRGRDPLEFGDYFSAVRWYTAPGHDTPGGKADPFKGKVSSSIAQLYRRPRVWLEGYHSLGWGATPARLMEATCENYLYGCNLLNLHGLYYTTHGGFWEWAPPCYHFRMPYWEHMGTFLKYFERLSYLLSQGSHRCDVAVLYPVTPGQAGLSGSAATETAFGVAGELLAAGRDFVFIDDDSLARAEFRDGRLEVSEAAYRVLVLPAMRAIRWKTLEKARDFRRAGGIVLAAGALPEASDRAGRGDAQLDDIVRELFGESASAPLPQGAKSRPQPHSSGGLGWHLEPSRPRAESLADALRSVPIDVTADTPIKALHRRIGPRDVYFVVGAKPGTEATFRARGRVEWWDPWTGETHALHTVRAVEGGTRVRLPLAAPEAQLIVFSPETAEVAVTETDLTEVTRVDTSGVRPRVMGFASEAGPKSASVEFHGTKFTARGIAPAGGVKVLDGDWDFESRPTMNNRWGDFRLPASKTDPLLGPEVHALRHVPGAARVPGWDSPDYDDSRQTEVHPGFGPRFFVLGPLPPETDAAALDRQFSALKSVDPKASIEILGKRHSWRPYDFSWRWGLRGDPGHQGFHGLKENVTDDFLCLGQPTAGHNETIYRPERGGSRYYLWTSAPVEAPTRVQVHLGGLAPAKLYLDGRDVTRLTNDLPLVTGSNPLLLRYESAGRGHFVLQRLDAGPRRARTPLAMRWFDEPGIVPFDVRPTTTSPVGWYRFVAPPGLRAFTLATQGSAVEAWIDGQVAPVVPVEALPGTTSAPGQRGFRVTANRELPRRSAVALRIVQARGEYGGATLSEPIRLECGPGLLPAGNWAEGSALETYSGGAWYRRSVVLAQEQLNGRVRLDLGQVSATAEVRLNGTSAGVRVAPPWTFDLERLAVPGTNRLEILVYNTLANFYRTIPTRYGGPTESGLLGPVRLEWRPETVLE